MTEETQTTEVALTLDCSVELDLRVTVGASVEAAIVDVNAARAAGMIGNEYDEEEATTFWLELLERAAIEAGASGINTYRYPLEEAVNGVIIRVGLQDEIGGDVTKAGISHYTEHDLEELAENLAKALNPANPHLLPTAEVNASAAAEPQGTGFAPTPEVNQAAATSLVNALRLGHNERLALLITEMEGSDGYTDREVLVNAIRRSKPGFDPRGVSATVTRALKRLHEKGLLDRDRLTPLGEEALAMLPISTRLTLTPFIEGN